MPTRKDKTNVTPIYKEQVFIPASGATLIKQKARPKFNGIPIASGAIDIVSPEFDLLTGARGLVNMIKPNRVYANIGNNSVSTNFFDAKDVQDAVKSGIREAREYVRHPVVQETVEHNRKLAERIFGEKSKNMGWWENGTKRVTANNRGEVLQHYVDRPVNIQNTNDLPEGWLGDYNSSIPRIRFKSSMSPYDTKRTVFHEGLHHSGFGNFEGGLYDLKAEKLFGIDDYLLGHEAAVHTAELGRIMGLGLGQKYPGLQAFKDMIAKYNVPAYDKQFIFNKAILNTPRDYKRLWDALTGKYFTGAGVAGTSLNLIDSDKMKCGGRRKAQLGLDIREGGIAIPIAPNMYYMNGRSHNEGGIGIGPNNKNGLEVEDGEVVKIGNNDVKVFSSVPFLRGISPAQLVMGGVNPNTVFKAQEAFKDRNRIKDDGTRYETGGQKIYTPSKSVQRQIQETGKITIGGAPTIGGLRTYGYLKGLTTARKFANKGTNIFTKGIDNLNKKLQSLVNERKISSKTAQFASSMYAQFIGRYGQNIPKTISLARDDNKKKFGGNMIYEINGNVKNGLMSTRPKAQYGKQRKVEGYGNTIVVGDDAFMLNEDGVYVPVGNVQINKQPKTVRGASGRRDIAYDRQGNRYQRRSDGSLIRVSPEKGNIAVSDTIRGVEVNAPDVTKTRSIKQIKAATKTNNAKANPPRQKVEPNFEIGDQTIVNFLRNSNGKYNTQRTPIHSFTPAQKLGLSNYGWSTYDDPNKGYSFREDAAAVRAGQKSVDEIIGQDLSQINFDDNQSSSTPRRGETKSVSSKTTTKPQSTIQNYKSNTPKIDLSKAKMPTFDISQLDSKETKTAKAKLNTSPTGGGTQSKDGRWIGQYKPVTTADWIGLGSNLAGTVASYFMTKNAINKMPDPIKPVMVQAAKLKTRYNINPQLTNITEVEQTNRAAVRRNTQSSNTSLAREQRLMNEARGARNVLHGQKENIETQLINQDRLNRQTVMMENVNRYNDYLNRLTSTRQAKNQLGISNINNLLSGLTGSVNNILGTIESRRATNNTLRAIAAANPNVDARLIGGFDYYIDPITKRKYNKNQQYVGTING